MPTALILRGYRFFFFSNENGEPAHTHVSHQGRKAKFWLLDCALAENRGFADHEIRDIQRHVSVYRIHLLKKWEEHFGP